MVRDRWYNSSSQSRMPGSRSHLLTFSEDSILYGICWNILTSRMTWAIWDERNINDEREKYFHHHSHFGKVDQVFLCPVRCSLVNESEVRQINAQIGNTRRVASAHDGIGKTLMIFSWNLCKASRRFLWRPSLDAMFWSLSRVFFV